METPARMYYRARWPDAEVPEGEPLWLLYEVDRDADTVLRSVELFADGKVTRNSIDLEQRNGDVCPSLIDCSFHEGFADVELNQLTPAEFEQAWAQGEDKPFWFPGPSPS